VSLYIVRQAVQSTYFRLTTLLALPAFVVAVDDPAVLSLVTVPGAALRRLNRARFRDSGLQIKFLHT